MKRRTLLFAPLPFALAACGGILPNPAPPPALYRLAAIPETAAPGPPLNVQIVVEPPSASASLDTARIALTRGAYGFDYFADAAWTDDAPALVAALVIHALEDSGRLPFVAGAASELRPDAILAMDLRHFEAAYAGAGPPRVEVEINAFLLRPADRTVLAARDFSGSVAVAANNVPVIVAAFDAALGAALRDMPGWVMASLPRGGQ